MLRPVSICYADADKLTAESPFVDVSAAAAIRPSMVRRREEAIPEQKMQLLGRRRRCSSW